MSERRISLGINVSILVILTIFGVLLSLPFRLLLNTNYGRNQTVNESDLVEAIDNGTVIEKSAVVPLDHRKLRLCPMLEYERRLKSVFHSDYDRNCTYRPESNDDLKEESKRKTKVEESEGTSMVSKETIDANLTENKEEIVKDHRSKSVPVAGHILVMMLLISAIAALVEVLRIRFARDKDSSKAGSASSRKTSTVELPVQRRFIPRQQMKSQRSFEIQGMNRSALRLLGAKPPPLIRRSSFPIQPLSKQTSISLNVTSNNWISRRQSAESDEEIGLLMSALHHRTRLIRRH